jgi:hypothetical protein
LNYTNDYAELINRFEKWKAFNTANPGKSIDHPKARELGQEILKVYYRMVNTFGDEKIDPELHKAMKDTETMYVGGSCSEYIIPSKEKCNNLL